jgi:hypothetical protein
MLFVPLAFGFGDHFPDVIEVWEIAFAEVKGLGLEGLTRCCWLHHLLESTSQGLVYHFLEPGTAGFANLVEHAGYIVVQA